MKIEQFVNSMLPSLDKANIREDLRLIREEVVNTTLPAYKSAVDAFKRTDFTADFTKKFNSRAGDRVDQFKGNYVETTFKAIEMSLKNIDALAEMIEKNFSSDILRDGMDYVKANMMQYKGMIVFMSQYARRLLLITYALETNPDAEKLSKGNSRDLQWLYKNQDAYFVCLNAALTKTKEVEEKFAEVPDILVKPENTETAVKTVGIARLDPFKAGLIPLALNPLYHIRMAWTDYQVKRYKLAKEELQNLELRLMLMKESREGKKDAKLERSIDHTEDRVAKLRYKLNKMEEGD